MKKIIITFLFIFTAFNLYGNPKDFLKRNLKLSDIHDGGEGACDLCGCYMGLDPNFAMNQVGMRFSMIKFYTPGHVAVETDPNTDHPGHTTEESTEYYNDVELYVRYYFTPKFRMFISLPFGSNDIDGKKLNGMGDAKVLAQYQVYNSSITGHTNFWQRLFLGGGLSVPTGVYNKQLTYGVVEPHFQPGTGSWGFYGTALHLAKLEKTGIGWRNDLLVAANTANNNGYRFANRFNWTSTFFYEIPASSLTILPHAGIYFETARQDTQDGAPVDGSGGDVWFATGGLDFYYGDFSLDMNYQYPFSQKFIGEQADNDFRIYAGFGYAF